MPAINAISSDKLARLIGKLTIEAGPWQRLSACSPANARRNDDFEPVWREQFARALLLQWAIISAGLVVFSSVVVSLQPPRNMPAIVIVFAFPVMFGITQLIRYVRARF